MTASSIAQLLHGKRYKQGCWKARCPIHQEKTASLNIREGKTAVLVHCFGCGADGKAVMQAIGLSPRHLFYSSETAPAVRQRVSQQDQLESLDRQLGLIAVLGAIDGKPAYWNAAEKRIKAEIDQLRCRLEPEKVYQEWRERMLKARVKKLGWEGLWEEVYGRM